MPCVRLRRSFYPKCATHAQGGGAVAWPGREAGLFYGDPALDGLVRRDKGTERSANSEQVDEALQKHEERQDSCRLH